MREGGRRQKNKRDEEERAGKILGWWRETWKEERWKKRRNSRRKGLGEEC